MDRFTSPVHVIYFTAVLGKSFKREGPLKKRTKNLRGSETTPLFVTFKMGQSHFPTTSKIKASYWCKGQQLK